MIVKNEEKNIERALSWGKGVVSEQIVVDTGSSDRTVELAEKMGATVYHYQWNDDFPPLRISPSARPNMSGLRFWTRMSISQKEMGRSFCRFWICFGNTMPRQWLRDW